MMCSRTLETSESGEMRQQLLALEGSPDLKIGITFHCEGTFPNLKGRLKRVVSFEEMDIGVFLSMMLEIPSGPDAVLVS